jgi:hypothetical protein
MAEIKVSQTQLRLQAEEIYQTLPPDKSFPAAPAF